MLGIRLSWSVVYPRGNLEFLVEEELTNDMSGSIQPKRQSKKKNNEAAWKHENSACNTFDLVIV